MTLGSGNISNKDTPQNERILAQLLHDAKDTSSLIEELGMPLKYLTAKYFGSPKDQEKIRRKEEK